MSELLNYLDEAEKKVSKWEPWKIKSIRAAFNIPCDKSLEKFKATFAQTSLFEDLNTQFPIYEIFEMNNGKFEISTVQQAYEEWSQPTTINDKRADFTKDLNKLISGDYVLVPKQPTAEIERAGMSAGGGFLAIKIFKKMVEAAQGSSL
ncbi:hypothetical protein [Acinetobacter beijerinckii]|uniref:hypothetical protein n=1 Tax=Acinetobacter beijerinckii TaxID=262668 RepID=UPI0024070925|nr:hypothetical protein [Acinetobacter beijerinckii]